LEHKATEHVASVVEGSTWWYVILALAMIAILGYLSWRATRRMERIPRGMQNVLEFAVESLYAFVRGIIGPQGDKYAPLIATFFLYIFCMNVLGLVPFLKSPTANPTITIALALTAFVMVQVYAIQANGLKGYIKHFTGDIWWLAPLMLPLHIIGELARPLSLSIRLFGNIFGEDMVIAKLVGLAVVVLPFSRIGGNIQAIPIPLQLPMMLFGIFTSFVQALVFSMLVCIYIAVAVTHEENGGQEAHEAHH